MRRNPRNLCLEQGNAIIQFVVRVGRKIFFRELTRSVSLGAGKIGFIHWPQHRKPSGLLSMCENGIRSTANRAVANV